MTIQPRRRWFQFGLRSLLLVITAICIWLGWNVRQVHRRAQILARIRNDFQNDHIIYMGSGLHSLSWEDRLPTVWRLLGARPQPSIAIGRANYSDEEIEEIRAIFPESNVDLFLPGANISLSNP